MLEYTGIHGVNILLDGSMGYPWIRKVCVVWLQLKDLIEVTKHNNTYKICTGRNKSTLRSFI